jgi:hypothetical protein
MSAFPLCGDYAATTRSAREVVSKIDSHTSPQDFDALREQYPDYSINDREYMGRTALFAASRTGNVSLIEHIVRQQGRLELLYRYIYTVLHYTVAYDQYAACKTLLDLGMPVNAISSKESSITALDLTIRKVCSFKLTKLLLFYGGTVHPKYSLFQRQSAPLDRAQKEVLQEKRAVFSALNGEECLGKTLPAVLIQIIADFHLPASYEI